MRLERVVAGIDFGPRSLDAARHAIAHLAPEAELVLLHSIYVPTPPAFMQLRSTRLDLVIATARRGAEVQLREFIPSMGAKLVWTDVRVGPPADRLVEAATDYDAGLVVVGPHGALPPPWHRLGSSAERVVRSGVAPVLVASRDEPRAPRKVLVALDDQPLPPTAVEWLRAIAARHGSTVTAAAVVHPEVLRSDLPTGPDDGTPMDAAALAGRLDRWLDGLRSELGLAPDRLVPRVAVGSSSLGIVEAATRTEADLVVLVSRPQRSGAWAILGGLEGAVLRGAPCSVLVVPDHRH